MADNPFRALSPSFRKAKPTPQGAAGFDNPRENIDPHVKTKVLDAKEIILNGALLVKYTDADAVAAVAAADSYVKNNGDTMTGTLNSQSIIPTATMFNYDLGSTSKRWRDVYAVDILATYLKNSGGSVGLGFSATTLDSHMTIIPSSTNSKDLGSAANKWKDLYYSGTLNGNNINVTGTISGANLVATGSGGTSAQWDAAYTHSQDNTQAHSDYMLNTGDTGTGDYVISGVVKTHGELYGFVADDIYNKRFGIMKYSGYEGVLVAGSDILLRLGHRTDSNDITDALGTFRPELVIDTAGNVGIGTATPGSKLSVVGLPTSPAGLSAGDIFISGSYLSVVR